MANTFELIASNVVGAGGVSGFTFSSIPATFTDLQINLSLRDTKSGVANDNSINFNGSATSFTGRRIFSDGSSAYSDSPAPYSGSSVSSAATASTFANTQIYIPNYTSSNNKSFAIESVTENNAGGANSAYAILFGGLWSNTAAITSISILAPSGFNFVQYSSFYLYGIKNS